MLVVNHCVVLNPSLQVGLLDHLFSTYQVNVMQTCDICASHIRGMEKACICSGEFKEGQEDVTVFKNRSKQKHVCLFVFNLACDLVCHKKCLNGVEIQCSKRAKQVKTLKENNIVSASTSISHVTSPLYGQNGSLSGSLYFGVPVSALITDTNPVPKVMEMLLFHVELNGLYTEGIYRKSGSACRAKELQQILDTRKKCHTLIGIKLHAFSSLLDTVNTK